MANFLAYLVLLVVMIVAFDMIGRLLVWATTGRAPRVIEWVLARLPRRGPAPPQQDIELVIAQLELRRLAEEVRRVHATDQPYRVHRIKAATGAYDDVLLQCCRLAKIDIPGQCDRPARSALTSKERFEVETALMAGGVDW